MVIAFIPVRGGSKSIPLKNIKPFCGKPLVCWTIEALEGCPLIDSIIVATDSPEIESVVMSRSYRKVEVYHRSAENASDTSSTESVMLEYIDAVDVSSDDVFMLVQATSPMTKTEDLTGGIRMFLSGMYDSVLSCVRNYRFFWNADGTSANYDYMARPRRQDFSGNLMENGAFYINTVGGIVSSGNRLSGRIGIYEMPEFTSFEIDEPDDWIVMETLMRRHVLTKQDAALRLFLSDVDGTLTDGGMYYTADGEAMKKFNTVDGMGFQLLRENGIEVGIITSEVTRIVESRARKLNVSHLVQGQKFGGKLQAAEELCARLGISLANVAYIGDDINCIQLLEKAGYAACPSTAVGQVRSIPGIHVMTKGGGDGCVREFIDYLLGNDCQRSFQ